MEEPLHNVVRDHRSKPFGLRNALHGMRGSRKHGFEGPGPNPPPISCLLLSPSRSSICRARSARCRPTPGFSSCRPWASWARDCSFSDLSPLPFSDPAHPSENRPTDGRPAIETAPRSKDITAPGRDRPNLPARVLSRISWPSRRRFADTGARPSHFDAAALTRGSVTMTARIAPRPCLSRRRRVLEQGAPMRATRARVRSPTSGCAWSNHLFPRWPIA
jgi:hypothetical protein